MVSCRDSICHEESISILRYKIGDPPLLAVWKSGRGPYHVMDIEDREKVEV